MADVVLDASAVLALLEDERGADKVWAHLPGARLSAVNAAEVIAKLVDGGSEPAEAGELLARLGAEIVPFEAGDVALSAGARRGGRALPLGARACLALAERLGLPALTADRSWAELGGAAKVELIR